MTASDRELLERSARGDRAAFGEFVEQHSANVHRYLRWLVDDANDVEDLLQKTFVDAWRAAAQARAEGGARTWLLAIARRNAGKWLARRGATREREQSLDELGELAGFGDAQHTPEQMARAAEERSLVEQALASLAPAEREILVLRELEGVDGAAAAELLGLSLAAQKSRLHRARLRLAAELRQRLRAEVDR